MDNKDIIFETDGEENEEELNIDLSKFNQAVIWGTDWTTETMARQLEKACRLIMAAAPIGRNPCFSASRSISRKASS